ncbi:unnamed protein product [Mytilus edulis]|uniref:GST C-terminal domain-containing protein n=1 Tax=Mytilus edulis TaxID=6550 RepID=A0A8S3Q1S3_MYTED|nr:unnamed protein product [Mytilus edulis]
MYVVFVLISEHKRPDFVIIWILDFGLAGYKIIMAGLKQDITRLYKYNFSFSSEEYIWRPAIIIENAVDRISVISDKYVPMRIASDGRVIWNPAGVYTVSCESDTTFYPMDTQECYLKVSAWVYTQAEIELHFKRKSVDKNFYTKNGEWNLLSAESFKSEAQTRDDHSFSSVTFLIKLQRRCLFHVVNTLFPVTLMAVLIAFVFKLPVDSGEKAEYGKKLNTEVLPKYFAFMAKLLNENGGKYLVGSKLSLVDVAFFDMLDKITGSKVMGADLYKDFDGIKTFYENVQKLPKIKIYLEKRLPSDL